MTTVEITEVEGTELYERGREGPKYLQDEVRDVRPDRRNRSTIGRVEGDGSETVSTAEETKDEGDHDANHDGNEHQS